MCKLLARQAAASPWPGYRTAPRTAGHTHQRRPTGHCQRTLQSSAPLLLLQAAAAVRPHQHSCSSKAEHAMRQAFIQESSVRQRLRQRQRQWQQPRRVQ